VKKAGHQKSGRTPVPQAAVVRPRLDPARFGIKPIRVRLVAVITMIACAALGFVTPVLWLVALVAVGVVAAVPSVQAQARRELNHRLLIFRNEVSVCDSEDIDKLEGLQHRRVELGLNEGEVASELDLLKGVLAVAKLKDSLKHAGLPTVSTSSALVNEQICYYVGNARLDKRGTQQDPGRLFLTSHGLVFEGTSIISVDWKHVASVKEQHSQLCIQRSDRQTPWTFTFESLAEAMPATLVAGWLAHHEVVQQFRS
jgi:hypothetical protein